MQAFGKGLPHGNTSNFRNDLLALGVQTQEGVGPRKVWGGSRQSPPPEDVLEFFPHGCPLSPGDPESGTLHEDTPGLGSLQASSPFWTLNGGGRPLPFSLPKHRCCPFSQQGAQQAPVWQQGGVGTSWAQPGAGVSLVLGRLEGGMSHR